MEQVARAVEGMPLSIPLSRISWIQDPEPGPGPLRPRGVGECLLGTLSLWDELALFPWMQP